MEESDLMDQITSLYQQYTVNTDQETIVITPQVVLSSIIEAHDLPAEYGTVEDGGDHWILNKRLDTYPYFHLPFKGCVIEFGYHPEKHLLFIRRMLYNKANFDSEYVKMLGLQTMRCPYCLQGRAIVHALDNDLLKYQSKQEQSMWQKVTSFLNSRLKVPSTPQGTLFTMGWGAGAAFATGLLFDNITTWSWLGRTLKVASGALALYGSLKLPQSAASVFLQSMGLCSIVSGLDPRPEQIAQIKRELQETKQLMRLGSGDVIKAGFVNPLNSLKMGLGVFKDDYHDIVPRGTFLAPPTNTSSVIKTMASPLMRRTI